MSPGCSERARPYHRHLETFAVLVLLCFVLDMSAAAPTEQLAAASLQRRIVLRPHIQDTDQSSVCSISKHGTIIGELINSGHSAPGFERQSGFTAPMSANFELIVTRILTARFPAIGSFTQSDKAYQWTVSAAL
jgi:hypothetical protein